MPEFFLFALLQSGKASILKSLRGVVKRIVSLLVLIGFCALSGKSWHWAKDGFSLSRTYCYLPKIPEELSDHSLDAMLEQTYTYLGRGHQCYAFESEDGNYVIKLPRYDRYRLSFFLRSFPFSFLTSHRENIRTDIERRLYFLLESFRLAFEELRSETALVYLHLQRTEHLSHPLIIKDRLGRIYRLDSNRTAFMIQEKKPIMMASFQDRLRKGDRKGAEEILDGFLHVLSARSEKGIYNKDPSFMRNFGWEKGRGFQIDIGSFYRKSNMPLQEAREKSFQETVAHVRNWLTELDTDMLNIFDRKTQKVKESWTTSDCTLPNSISN